MINSAIKKARFTKKHYLIEYTLGKMDNLSESR